ncbi:MAG TPA: hypothetical protein VJJ22_02670 [Candidatus Paceibacterota bacterium]
MGRPQVSSYTPAQLEALEEFISLSKDATDFAKRVIMWLLQKTNGLTEQVFVFLPVEKYGEKRVEEVQNGAHGMNSFNGSTHLNSFLHGMGSKFHLGHGYGHPALQSQRGRCLYWELFPRKVAASDLPNLKPPSLRILQGVAPKPVNRLQLERVNQRWPSKIRQ